MKEIKLKPCPFCGVELIPQEDKKSWVHPSSHCILSRYRVWKFHGEIEMWNTRKPLNNIAEKIENAIKETDEKHILMGLRLSLKFVKDEENE